MLNILSFALVTCFCTFVSVTAMQWGQADSLTIEASKVMANWADEPSISADAWKSAHRLIDAALENDPHNAVHHEIMSNLHFYSWASMVEPGNNFDKLQSADLAVHHIDRAVSLRPNWPSGYAQRSQLLKYLDPLSEQLEKDLISIAALGPYESSILVESARVGAMLLIIRNSKELMEATVSLLVNGLFSYDVSVYAESRELAAALKGASGKMLKEELVSRLVTTAWKRADHQRIKEIIDWQWDSFSEEHQLVLGGLREKVTY